MDVAAILKPRSVRTGVEAGSKKAALEVVSEMLADAVAGPSAAEVLDGLASRERLGCTSVGGGAAIPHARLAGLDEGAAAFLKLAEPVDFDAPDGVAVDLLLGVLLPEEPETTDAEEIAVIARGLQDPKLQAELRASDDPDALRQLLIERLAPGARNGTHGG
ncbi:MAG TPA: PTS sugar transporter subunit IIA [Gammaproteobacteria bacterium]